MNASEQKIAVIGLGYVGIPLSICMADRGLSVTGFDVNEARVDQLNTGQSPLKSIPSEDIARMARERFTATTDFSLLTQCSAIIICVPTPLDKTQQPDLSYVEATMASIGPHLVKGQVISLESTTWPGTTHEIMRPYIEARGFTVGADIHLIYSPEREDPGNQKYSTATIPKVVGGESAACLAKGVALYEQFIDQVVPVSSTQAAELVKLLENIQRSVNIGLMNEMKIVADQMDLDIFEIVDAAATKPFGFSKYYPGPGVGGHCIPIDPFYLTWKAREYGVRTRFIELAGEINAAMPKYVVQELALALNKVSKSIRDSRILCVGLAYKPNVDDVRESPSVHVMEELRELGADLHYHDPYIPTFPKMRDHKFDLSSVDLSQDYIDNFDAVVLLTNHANLDYDQIRKAKILIDTRGALRSI